MHIVRREYFIQVIIRQASNCLSVCMLSNFNFIHQSIPSWDFLCYISQFPFLHHFDHSSQHHIWMEEYHTACKWDTVRLKYSQECWRLPILYIMASTYISKGSEGQEIPSPWCLRKSQLARVFFILLLQAPTFPKQQPTIPLFLLTFSDIILLLPYTVVLLNFSSVNTHFYIFLNILFLTFSNILCSSGLNSPSLYISCSSPI
jgi:hypothetical protein